MVVMSVAGKMLSLLMLPTVLKAPLMIALTLAFSYFLVRFAMRLLSDKVGRALGFV